MSFAAMIQITQQIHNTLDHDNFLLWKSQITHVLRGNALLGYIDGSKAPPPVEISGAAGTSMVNLDFERWQQQDQLVLAWLFSTIYLSLLAQVINCETSADLWKTLSQIYVSKSMVKILDLKLQLQTIKKGELLCKVHPTNSIAC
jgi:intracellular septation protein A